MSINSANDLILIRENVQIEKLHHLDVNKSDDEINKTSDIDDVFDLIGQFGPYQLLIIVLVGLIAASAAISSYLTIFTDAAPEFRCKLPLLTNDTFEITSEYQKMLVDLYIPTSKEDKSCKIKQYNNDSSMSSNNFTLVNCKEWVYSKEFYDETIVTRFNYVCDREQEKGIYKTLLFAGQFGVIVIGLLADKFGRKNIAYLFLVLNGCVAILFAIISNVNLSDSTFKILFGTLRFFSGCTSNIYSLAVVFAVEIVGPSYRVLAANTIYYFFIFGEFICLLLGYFFRDYKEFYLYSAIVISSGVVYFWCIPESPRYLILNQRYKEVNELFTKIGKYNRKAYNCDLKFESPTTATATPSSTTTTSDSIKRKLSIFKNKRILLIIIASMINWFTNSFVYNGLSYNIDVLGGDPYLNFLYSSLAELAGVASSQYLLKKFGRKIPYVSNLILISVSLCVIGVVPEDSNAIIIVCVLLGKFAISFTFNAIYVITSESYPTEIRNTAVSFLATFARIGGTIATYVQLSGAQVWKPLPYVIYGLMALMSAILFVFLTPETKGRKMPETIEDMLKDEEEGLVDE